MKLRCLIRHRWGLPSYTCDEVGFWRTVHCRRCQRFKLRMMGRRAEYLMSSGGIDE